MVAEFGEKRGGSALSKYAAGSGILARGVHVNSHSHGIPMGMGVVLGY